MPEAKPQGAFCLLFPELHDAHVTAALDDRSEQHFRWMMEQDRPELSTEDQDLCDKLEASYQEEWEKVDRHLEPLVRGAASCPDIVEYQRREEELEARRERILADRRKLFETQTEEDAPEQKPSQDQKSKRPNVKAKWDILADVKRRNPDMTARQLREHEEVKAAFDGIPPTEDHVRRKLKQDYGLTFS